MPAMQIAADAHVTLRYAVAIDSDAKPDCDADGQVTEFVWGRGQILPGLEAKLAGHGDGDRLDLVLPAAEAFGEHDPALDLRVPFSDFPDNAREVLKPGMAVFDTVYNPAETLLLKEAREKGAMTIDGVAMFVNQAAAQFRLFTGQSANTNLMRKVVLDSLRR